MSRRSLISGVIGSYDGSAGYAAPLEKGLADRVTVQARRRQPTLPLRPDLGGKTLAQYVRNDKSRDCTKAARKLRARPGWRCPDPPANMPISCRRSVIRKPHRLPKQICRILTRRLRSFVTSVRMCVIL